MEFIALKAQQVRIKDKIDTNIQRVLTHEKYILGPEVAEEVISLPMHPYLSEKEQRVITNRVVEIMVPESQIK